MVQRCTDSGSALLNETRAKALDFFKAVTSVDRRRRLRVWQANAPRWGVFLLLLLAINTIVAVAGWLVVAAIRG